MYGILRNSGRSDLAELHLCAEEQNGLLQVAVHLPEPRRGVCRQDRFPLEMVVDEVTEPGEVTPGLDGDAVAPEPLELLDAGFGQGPGLLEVAGGPALAGGVEGLLLPADIRVVAEVAVIAVPLPVDAAVSLPGHVASHRLPVHVFHIAPYRMEAAIQRVCYRRALPEGKGGARACSVHPVTDCADCDQGDGPGWI
ncbi:MAG: hypothetical protein RRA92_03990 [Gemmatimonadota bacterium]|nr:hypothetical protein [Gemmatimonadota bacterium]